MAGCMCWLRGLHVLICTVYVYLCPVLLSTQGYNLLREWLPQRESLSSEHPHPHSSLIHQEYEGAFHYLISSTELLATVND